MLPLLLLLQAATAPAAPVPWAVQTRTDPVSGATATFAAARSADGNARLVVRCDRVDEPTVSVQLQLRALPLSAADAHDVSLAADGAAPIAASWSFPGNAAYIADPDAVTKLTVAIAAARTLTLTTTDADAAVSASFPGAAGNPAIRQVLEACGYALGVVPAPIKPAKGK